MATPLGALEQVPEHNSDATIGFIDQENIGLACLSKFLGCLEAKVPEIMHFLSAILKVQNGQLAGVCANGNMDFWIPQGLKIPKMYRFANLHETPTELHSEPD